MAQPVTHATVAPDLTTPKWLSAEFSRLKKMVGTPGADVWMSINSNPDSTISVYSNWCHRDGGPEHQIGRFGGNTFAEMIASAEIAIRNWKVTRHDSVIRKMALAIIELTDSHCECTETLLRGKGFSAADITEYRDRACERASEMCSNAPFSVEAR